MSPRSISISEYWRLTRDWFVRSMSSKKRLHTSVTNKKVSIIYLESLKKLEKMPSQNSGTGRKKIKAELTSIFCQGIC